MVQNYLFIKTSISTHPSMNATSSLTEKPADSHPKSLDSASDQTHQTPHDSKNPE
ncbi:hypothetical protein Hanom_Chr12g01171111 [Helianthus anomalus]